MGYTGAFIGSLIFKALEQRREDKARESKDDIVKVEKFNESDDEAVKRNGR